MVMLVGGVFVAVHGWSAVAAPGPGGMEAVAESGPIAFCRAGGGVPVW